MGAKERFSPTMTITCLMGDLGWFSSWARALPTRGPNTLNCSNASDAKLKRTPPTILDTTLFALLCVFLPIRDFENQVRCLRCSPTVSGDFPLYSFPVPSAVRPSLYTFLPQHLSIHHG